MASLVPYVRNARTHSPEQVAQIAASIQQWGWTMPVLVDEVGMIIAGHGRVLAAQSLGLAEVPCMTAAGWSDAQKRAYVLADNKLAENAGWDTTALASELKLLSDEKFEMDLVGFDAAELSRLLAAAARSNVDPDDVPPALPTPVTRAGDVWLLGNHRLMCGDATKVEDVAKLCRGKTVDLLLTDPPYNVKYEGGTKDALTIMNDDMGDAEFRSFLRAAFVAADSVMRKGAVFYIWHADTEGLNFRGAVKESGWTVRQCLIWKKSSLVLGRQDYQWQHEPCLYGWKDGAAHAWFSDRSQTTILEFDKPSRNGEHPTMKPVALVGYQLQNSTQAGDVVLDLFGGSGSTMIAAEQLGRSSLLLELDPIYCDVIVARWQAFTNGKAVLEGTTQTFESVHAERVAA